MKGKWKQKSKKKKGNVVLRKYMVAVDEFIKSKNGTEEAGHHQGLRFVKKKSRKEQRKEKRKLKKAKMKRHYEGNKAPVVPPDDDDKQPQVQKKKKERKGESNTIQPASAPKVKLLASKKGKKVNKLQESRKLALLEANEQEDREIKKLERCLGLNKRKNKKSLPQSFVADGLDYILGMLDSGSTAAGVYDDDDDMDIAKDNFEKLDENDSQSSGEAEEPEDKMASGGSDEDMAAFDDDDDDEGEEEEEEDELIDADETEEEEEIEDDQDEMDESDENERETQEEADAPDTKTSETVR